MYHFFHGSDRGLVRDAANQLIEQHLPLEAQVTVIDTYNYQPGCIVDALGSTSLFGEAQWFVLDTPSDTPEFNEEVLESLSALAESVNTFVVLEGKVLVPEKKRYAKHAATTEEFVATATESFNMFSLADALADRDKRRLWLLMQEARLNGKQPEEMIGILWWQLKTIRLAAETSTAEAAGMKPYPYNKARRAVAKYPNGQAAKTARSLLRLYHAGHAGERDLELALERWVLTL